MNFGDRLAEARKNKGLTQEALAELLNVSPQAVSKWENGQNYPDITLLPKLSEALCVSIDELMNGKKAPAVKMVPAEQRKDLSDLILRIQVDSADKDRVRANLPLTLVQAAMEMGAADMFQVSGSKAMKEVDLNKVMALAKLGALGNLVEVDTADGDTVRVFVEEI